MSSWVRGMAQVGVLPIKHKVLGSNSSTAKKQNKKLHCEVMSSFYNVL
jgi:hypothetical protein